MAEGEREREQQRAVHIACYYSCNQASISGASQQQQRGVHMRCYYSCCYYSCNYY